MGLQDRPSDKHVSLLVAAGEPVGVGQASEEEPEDLAPGEGALLSPLEGAGKPADAPVGEGQAAQRHEREDAVQEAGEIEDSADKPEA
jgi:hypothetical protein